MIDVKVIAEDIVNHVRANSFHILEQFCHFTFAVATLLETSCATLGSPKLVASNEVKENCGHGVCARQSRVVQYFCQPFH